MTKDLIILSQKGDSSATLKLIEKFDPLLKKYAYKLYYEDAYNDLLFDFIKFLHNILLKRMRDTMRVLLFPIFASLSIAVI